MLRFWLRLFVRGPDETAFDSDSTVVIEDHERAAARDVVGIVRLPLGFQPLDLGLKFAELGIHIFRKFIRRLVLFGEAVEFRLYRCKSGLIFRRKLDRMRIGPPHAVGMREIEMGFRPFPSLGRPNRIGFATKLCRHQQIKQRHVFQIAAAILGEEVPKDRAACFGVRFETDKARAAVGCGHMVFGENATDGAGIPVIG